MQMYLLFPVIFLNIIIRNQLVNPSPSSFTVYVSLFHGNNNKKISPSLNLKLSRPQGQTIAVK